MDCDVKRDGRALRRIVMLLLALAGLAERAAAMPFATRAAVLAILRPAEAAAWAFALGARCVPAAVEGDWGRSQVDPLEASDGDDDPGELMRIAAGLRMLALVVAGWAVEALSLAAAGSRADATVALQYARSGGRWRGPPALPAPDTS